MNELFICVLKQLQTDLRQHNFCHWSSSL